MKNIKDLILRVLLTILTVFAVFALIHLGFTFYQSRQARKWAEWQAQQDSIAFVYRQMADSIATANAPAVVKDQTTCSRND